MPLHYFDQIRDPTPGVPVHAHYHWLNQANIAQNPLFDGRIAYGLYKSWLFDAAVGTAGWIESELR